MATSWQHAAFQQVDLIADRLRELLSSGLNFVHSEFGVDLGLKPEFLPQWVIYFSVGLGLLVMVALWASACRGLFKKQSIVDENNDIAKVSPSNADRTGDQKKKKRKPVEKKTLPNGRAVMDILEEGKPTEVKLQYQPSEVQTDKGAEAKKMKKPKTAGKETKTISSPASKDDESWETKVSNRGKREQRRKEKGTGDDSGSPPGAESPKAQALAPPAQRKNKGEAAPTEAEKGDAVVPPAVCKEVLPLNGGGRKDKAKSTVTPKTGNGQDNQTTTKPTTGHGQDYQPTAKPTTGHGQDNQTTTKPRTGQKSQESFWVQEIGVTVGECQSISAHLGINEPSVEDEWSGLRATVNSSSDWNGPAEVWGNFEEPLPPELHPLQEKKVLEAVKAIKIVSQVSDEEKVDSATGGTVKSKKKKKKTKKDEDSEAVVQESERPGKDTSKPIKETAAVEVTVEEPVIEKERSPVQEKRPKKSPTQVPRRPAEAASIGKSCPAAPSQQIQHGENLESPKQVKKKKARRDT